MTEDRTGRAGHTAQDDATQVNDDLTHVRVERTPVGGGSGRLDGDVHASVADATKITPEREAPPDATKITPEGEDPADATRITPEREDPADATRITSERADPTDDTSMTPADGSSSEDTLLRRSARPFGAAHDGDEPPPLGTVIRERFELESLIGVGSMGIVYRAIDRLHLEMHDRDPFVAIKVLSPKFRQYPNALMTLQREVRKAQVLAHENIISVYTFDRDGAIAYMTMELLDGKPLSAVIAEHPDGVPPAEAVTMIVGMARALAYAHLNDIIHSDFKPGNVFLTRKGQIKVLDFGVARAVSADGTDPRPAHERELGGYTPAYASIEMLRGERPVPADDVFALAIVSHQLLTGRHPFDQAPIDVEQHSPVDAKQLKGLRWSQRKALARALGVTRDLRHADAGAFLKHFTSSEALRTQALIALLVSALVGLGAFVGLRDDAAQPTVAFDDLPPATQQEFNAAIREGQTALRFGDAGINDAFAYFSGAYALHPNNPRAIDGLEDVADRFLGSIRGTDTATQRQVFELLYCQDYLAGYAPVAATCADVLGAECARIARACISD